MIGWIKWAYNLIRKGIEEDLADLVAELKKEQARRDRLIKRARVEKP